VSAERATVRGSVRPTVRRAILVAREDRWIRCGRIEVWPGRRLVRVDDRIIALTPVECAVVMALIEAAGEPVSRHALVARAPRRASGRRIGSRTVDTHVYSLRKKLEDDPADPTIIVTVSKTGYAIEP
jgi:DNA-binding response OmpR family regulator